MARLHGRKEPKIGPSDTSDTLSDRPDAPVTDTDDAGTGEDVSAPGTHEALHVERGADRVVDAREAGLGGGLDEAEEADADPVAVPRKRRR